ncbi:LacI family DNA-binding transcriptional regulator [Leifsonia sp. McL0607]|uniref:LacI family DNA-binding transcriptional regulator n=1 Tax=Leifsonia sp. McL0607 TaxID=3415672 RepID=UPI003CEEE8D5
MASEKKRERQPTLSDVATFAGTSVPTVSKVLRGGTDISPATRDRVMIAVREVGYSKGVPRPRARSLSSEAPPLIDLVVNHVDGSWANRVLVGVEREAAAANVDVVITIARDDGDWVSRLLRRPSQGAVIVLVDPTSAQLAALAAGGVPVVLVTPMSRPAAPVPSVGVTNWEGGRSAAEHLLELGHTRFGVIAGGHDHLYNTARIDGFRSAVRDAGADEPHVAYADWNRELAAERATELLSAEDRPTAVFACSDVMALGVYDAARSLGLSIPGDLSVVGFDDGPEAEWATPAITTVHQPVAEMGAGAVGLLFQTRRRGGDDERSRPPRVELSTSLVARGSTSAPRG